MSELRTKRPPRTAENKIAQPEIDALPGVPEVFADIFALQTFEDVVRITLGRQVDQFGTYEQVGLLLMPIRGWRRSHLLARELYDRGAVLSFPINH